MMGNYESWGIKPVDPAELLERFERRIQQKAGLPADCVFVSLLPDRYHLDKPPGQQFVTIFPGRWPLDQRIAAGAGRCGIVGFDNLPTGLEDNGDGNRVPSEFAEDSTGFDAEWRITVFARMNADQEGRSTRAVREATRGVLALAMKVLSAVHFFVPLDKDNNALVREYPRVLDLTLSPQEADGKPWVFAAFPLQVRFTAKMPVLPFETETQE